MQPKPPVRSQSARELQSTVNAQRQVIDKLCEASQEALHAIAATWSYVDFPDALRETAHQIEAALASAEKLKASQDV